MLARALIVLLSVLNLGVVVWWIAHDPPSPAATVQLPPGVARLQLVAERGASPAPPPATPTASNESVQATASPPAALQCFSFGPFASAEAVAAADARLKPLVRAVSVRQQPTASGRGWRVYLPPLPSLEQAQGIAQRIGAAGFSDYLVVREGVEANSIALGRYSSEPAAKKHAEALNAAGFAAQVEALGDQSERWLDVVAEAAFDPRRAQAAIGAAQHRRADCPPAR